jgi:ribosome-associated translation inhibitor RaiA
MQIQVNTDNTIQGRDALVARVTTMAADVLARHADHITRVEIHLTDENGSRSGPHDQRCVIEARLEGFQPLVASDVATSLDQSVQGAAAKLLRMIDSHLGRVRDRRHAPADTRSAVDAVTMGDDEAEA